MKSLDRWSHAPARARRSPRLLLPAIVAVGLAAITVSLAAYGSSQDRDHGRGDDGDRGRTYAIGLWGDLPYSTTQATTGVPNLIADMNAQDLAFTAHDGDLKQGSNSPCDDQLYIDSLARFNSLDAPAAFTPGDNDWTDCDRPNNGGFDSLERLGHERAVIFNTPFTLGKHRLHQEVQTDPLCLGWVNGQKTNVPCVENRRWDVRGVTYATLNVQGSCNNLCDTAPDPAEFAARNHANIVWLQETFAHAVQHQSAAVMLITQADPGWDLNDGMRAPFRDPMTLGEKLLASWLPPASPVYTDSTTDGYQAFLLALRDEVIAFRRPVAYVHGDSHYFRVDKPFLDAQGRRLENFTRVETFGDNQANGNNDVNWLKVVVDSHSREVFSYEPQIVPANRTAVPPPNPF